MSSHVGLGHAARDAALARVLAGRGLRVEYCSAPPASAHLEAVGVPRAPWCPALESLTPLVEEGFGGGRGFGGLWGWLGVLRRNYGRLVEAGLLERLGGYCAVFADEFWELLYPAPPSARRGVVFGTDFVYKPYRGGLWEFLASLALNRLFRRWLPSFDRLLFLGDWSDVPWGASWLPLGLGGRVGEWVKRHAVVVGPVQSFELAWLPGAQVARGRLGAGDRFVAVVSVGGSAIGARGLLGLVSRILGGLLCRLGVEAVVFYVLGPRARWEPPEPPCGRVEYRVLGHAPGLLDLYAAGDLFVSRAGRTSVADLECLGKPAIVIPVRGHFEQEAVARAASARSKCLWAVEEGDEEGLRAALAEALGYALRGARCPGWGCGGPSRLARQLLEGAHC